MRRRTIRKLKKESHKRRLKRSVRALEVSDFALLKIV